MIGCVVLFSELSALPEQLGLFQFLDRRIMDGNHDLAFLGLPIALLILFCPIYVAAWFFRICYRLAYPGTGKSEDQSYPLARLVGSVVLSSPHVCRHAC